jgi:secreted trypsin-like serine protease
MGHRLPRVAPLLAVIAAFCLSGVTATSAHGKSPSAHASIVGGGPASPSQWGFTVALIERGRLICSGTVISSTRVLTAAHCASGPPSTLAVVAKVGRLGDPGGEQIGVSAVAAHPLASTGLHDLAVLTLAQPTTAPVITLPTPSEDAASTYPGAPLTIAGFGRKSCCRGERTKAGVLRAARVTVRTGCFRYGARFFTVVSQVCAQGRPFPHQVISRDICSGDSGGPLVANTPSGPRLVGITSYGVEITRGFRRGILCGFWKTPSVFARVANGLDFIQANL